MKDFDYSALPIWKEYEYEMLSNGETVRLFKVRPLNSHPVRGDDVILFTDKDGSWTVEYENGKPAYKRRFYI